MLLHPSWWYRGAALFEGALDAFRKVAAAALFGMFDMPVDALLKIGVAGQAVVFVPVPVDHVRLPASR